VGYKTNQSILKVHLVNHRNMKMFRTFWSIYFTCYISMHLLY